MAERARRLLPARRSATPGRLGGSARGEPDRGGQKQNRGKDHLQPHVSLAGPFDLPRLRRPAPGQTGDDGDGASARREKYTRQGNGTSRALRSLGGTSACL